MFPRVSPRAAWVLAAVVSLAVVVLAILSASYARLPLYWQDEAGYLSNAQVMAGVGHVPQLSGRPYSIGWSLLIVPLWWILRDGQSVYVASVVLSAVIGVLVMVPLALIARRLNVATPWAIVLAGCVALSPARDLYAGFAMSENVLTLLVAFAVLFALRYAARQTVRNAVVLGVLVALAFLTHGRAVPLLVATALWFVWKLRTRLRASILGLALLIVVTAVGYLLYKHVTGLLYAGSASREGIGIDRLIGSDPLGVLLSAVGQAWYLVFAWLGLTVLGLVAVGQRLLVELRARRPGVGVWAALSLIGVGIISFTYISEAISRGASRLDIYSYGRYLDPFLVPLALVGLVLLARTLTRRVALGLVVAVTVTAVAWFAIVYPRLPQSGPRLWFPINILGTLQFPWHGTTTLPAAPWAYLSAFGIAAAVVVFLLRRRPGILLGLLVVYFAASSVVGEVRIIRPFFSGWETSFTLRTDIRDDPLLRDHPVALDTDGLKEIGDSVSKNAYQVLLAPSTVTLFDSADEPPPTDLVIARKDWDGAAELGARRVAVDTGMFSNALWVLPGALEKKLEASGMLH